MKPFIIIGHGRSGTVMLQTSLKHHPKLICYPEILTHVRDRRVKYQYKYFYENNNKWIETDVEDYLSKYLLKPNTGFKILLHQISHWSLWEYLSKQDINIIHIKRNPIMCYISRLQARQSGVWFVDKSKPTTIKIEPIEIPLYDFCNYVTDCEIFEKNLKELNDIYSIKYKNLYYNYNTTLRGVFKYLGVSDYSTLPDSRKINNVPIKKRVTNWNEFYEYISTTSYDFLLKDLI